MGSHEPADGELPADMRLRLDAGLRLVRDGTVLIGGSPRRLVRLSAAGASRLDAWSAGAVVGAAPREQRLARRLLDAGIVHPMPGAAPYPALGLSVVIPVRDRAAACAGLLGVLGSGGSLGEVLVIDDGSIRPLPGAAARHDRPRGRGAARNTGWRASRGAIVAFLDSDCRPADGWLDHALPHFADPRVAAVAPRIRCGPESAGALARYELHRSPLDLGAAPGAVRPRGRIPYVPTAALLVRRSVLHELHGFDERLRYGEDVDLIWRIVRTGRSVRYEPAAVVHHPPRASLGGWIRQRFDYGTSAAPLSRRHPGAVAPAAVSAWSLGAWLLVALGHPRAAAAVAVLSASLLRRRLAAVHCPPGEAWRLAARGQLTAGTQLAAAVTRTWWPLALVAAIGSRRACRAVGGGAAGAYLLEWAQRRPALDPVRWIALRLADDVSYGTGVWAGCLRERTWQPLRPHLAHPAPSASRAFRAGESRVPRD